MTENYDTSWDMIESDEGNLPDDKDAYERKYREWMERGWIPWLREHLSFPFQVERMEDEDDAYFTDVAEHKPFRLDHVIEVIGVESEEDDRCGVIVQVKEATTQPHQSEIQTSTNRQAPDMFDIVDKVLSIYRNREGGFTDEG